MVFRDDEERDDKVGEGAVAFTELLSDPRFLFRTIQVAGGVNIFLWVLALIFSDRVAALIDLLGQFGDKPRFVPLIIPFFSGLVLVYSLARYRSPDLEDRKLLDSEIMGSMAYGDEANRRFVTWIAAIIAGVVNAVAFAATVNAMSSSGLTLIG